MAHDADLATQPRSRRNLLAVAGAGAAAAIATLVSGNRVRAGHDGSNVLHLGEANTAPVSQETGLLAEVSSAALRVRNEDLGDGAAAVAGSSTNGDGIHGDSENFHGVFGHSANDLGVFGTSAAAAPPGAGVRGYSEHGDGVQGFSTTGRGVTGDSQSAPGGAFNSQTEFGVEGRSATNAGVAGFGVGGPGVHGASQNGPGVDGHSEAGPGVSGFSTAGPGVAGGSDGGAGGSFESQTEVGVEGRSATNAGVAGFGVGGPGVHGASESGAGVDGNSQTGSGVNGHSHSGAGGTFDTEKGEFAVYISGNAASFALGVDNGLAGEDAGGILATSRGGKPTIEGDAFPHDDHPGVGVQGVAYLGTGYEDGVFGAGPGTGVEGISGTGMGVRGHSDSGHGGSFESSSGFGVEAHSQDLVGVGGFSVNDLGVLGIGGTGDSDAEGDGVGGFSFHSVGGRFVSFDGIGVRAVSPGDNQPALQAASGTPTGQHAEPNPDGGLALEVIGKSRFSTAGVAVLPQGQSSVFVSNAAVTEHSHITVTLAGDPGNRHLRWVARDPGNGFTVHLSFAPPSQRPETPLSYLIVEPGGG